MTKKTGSPADGDRSKRKAGVGRRDFVKAGAAGLGGAALFDPGAAQAQTTARAQAPTAAERQPAGTTSSTSSSWGQAAPG